MPIILENPGKSVTLGINFVLYRNFVAQHVNLVVIF